MNKKSTDNSRPDLDGQTAPQGAKLPPTASTMKTDLVSGPPTPPKVLESAKTKEDSAESTHDNAPHGAEDSEPPITDPIEFLDQSLKVPNNSDIAEMFRFAKKRLVDAQIEEHKFEWLDTARPLLDSLDNVPGIRDPLRVKRTLLLLCTADYMAQPRQRVFDLDYTINRSNWALWKKQPAIYNVYKAMHKAMQDEILEAEIESIRHATRVTRMSAGRAAEVRRDFLENSNPWVALQAARDISQSADRDTASKASVSHTHISASLTEAQVQQLLERASTELEGWNGTDQTDIGHANGRPVIIVEQPKSEQEYHDQVPPPTAEEDDSPE